VALRLPDRLWRIGLALLLSGYLLGSRFALDDYKGRRAAAALSAQLSTLPAAQQREVVEKLEVPDPRVVATRDNPWCIPFPGTGSWLDDPAIPPQLIDGWTRSIHQSDKSVLDIAADQH
jgi:hypothetical protein